MMDEAVLGALLIEMKEELREMKTETRADLREMKNDNKAMLHHPPCAELQVLQGQIRVLWVALCALCAFTGWVLSSG